MTLDKIYQRWLHLIMSDQGQIFCCIFCEKAFVCNDIFFILLFMCFLFTL